MAQIPCGTNIEQQSGIGGGELIDYENPEEKKSSELRVAFEDVLAKGQYGRPTVYEKVAALTLRWDDDHDNLKVVNEVKELEDVLEHDFHYEVTSKSIQCPEPETKKAQQQVNAMVANWVFKNDDRKNLLVIYYAGHGVPGASGQLIMNKFVSSSYKAIIAHKEHSKSRLRPSAESNKFIWNTTEKLIQDTDAHIFLIFDWLEHKIASSHPT